MREPRTYEELFIQIGMRPVPWDEQLQFAIDHDYTVNEVREMLRLPAIEGGERLCRS